MEDPGLEPAKWSGVRLMERLIGDKDDARSREMSSHDPQGPERIQPISSGVTINHVWPQHCQRTLESGHEVEVMAADETGEQNVDKVSMLWTWRRGNIHARLRPARRNDQVQVRTRYLVQ